MYTLTITADSFAELEKKIQAAARPRVVDATIHMEPENTQDTPAPVEVPAPVEAPAPKKVAKKAAKKSPKKTKPAEPKVYNAKDIIAALTPVVDTLGKAVGVEVLKAFDATKISEVAVEKIPEFVKYCAETLSSCGEETQTDAFA